MSDQANYKEIVRHYESCLERHGDSHLGVDWPNEADALTRYRVMFELIREDDEAVSLLDFGCGTGHFYEWILEHEIKNVTYTGLDLSARFVELSRQKFPDIVFHETDLLMRPDDIPQFDYIVANGVFTEKLTLPDEEMFSYFKRLIGAIFNKARRGIAFNVLSKHVDWERDDLFHLSHDALAAFLVESVSRNYIIRADYGLYEYTTYVYR